MTDFGAAPNRLLTLLDTCDSVLYLSCPSYPSRPGTGYETSPASRLHDAETARALARALSGVYWTRFSRRVAILCPQTILSLSGITYEDTYQDTYQERASRPSPSPSSRHRSAWRKLSARLIRGVDRCVACVTVDGITPLMRAEIAEARRLGLPIAVAFVDSETKLIEDGGGGLELLDVVTVQPPISVEELSARLAEYGAALRRQGVDR